MSGITDTSFRGLCHEAGAGLAYTGLISANALRHGSEKTLGLLSFAPDDHPIAAQLFGADPQIVAAAAAIAVERGADIVDINMGCAVPKVLRAGAGAALLADPPRAEAMARAVVKAAAGHPVSVKMRRGWPDRGEDAASLARRLEQAGAAIIAIHPRWASQGLRGRADWSVITEVKQALSIPVIGNGDVRGPDDARRMLAQTGCDAVMVGRAALGNPWIFSRIGAALRGQPLPAPPTPEDRIAMAARHLHLVIADRGPAVAVREMRKHFAWYLKGLPNAAALRDRANGAKTEAQMQAMLDQAANELAAAATRPSSSGGRR
jgi:nifR3 family TIM-barrel protein